MLPQNELESKIIKFKKLEEFELIYNAIEKSYSAMFSKNRAVASIRMNFYKIADAIIRVIKSNRAEVFEIITYIDFGNRFISHLLKVAIISGVIAMELPVNMIHKLQAIVISALLHDVGKIKQSLKYFDSYIPIDSNISPDKLLGKLHPIFSKNIAIDFLKMLHEVGDMIAKHHEQIDGKGFPYKLDREKISLEDNVLFTANFIENLLMKTDFQGPQSLKNIINLLLEKYDSKFYDEVKSALKVILRYFEKDRRRVERYKVSFPIIVHYGGEGSSMSLMSYDISPLGIRFKTKRHLPVGTTINISFKLPDTNTSIKDISANVIWCRVLGERESEYNVGCEFIDISQSDRAKLIGYLEGKI